MGVFLYLLLYCAMYAILTIMKKAFIITPIIAAVIIGGTLFALNKETPVEEPIKSQAVVKTIEKATETAPEATEVVETTIAPTQAVKPVQVPVMTLEYVTENTPTIMYSSDGAYKLTQVKFSALAMNTIIYNTYQKDSSKFIEGKLESIVAICVDQFTSAVTTAKEAGDIFDYRTFVCSL